VIAHLSAVCENGSDMAGRVASRIGDVLRRKVWAG